MRPARIFVAPPDPRPAVWIGGFLAHPPAMTRPPISRLADPKKISVLGLLGRSLILLARNFIPIAVVSIVLRLPTCVLLPSLLDDAEGPGWLVWLAQNRQVLDLILDNLATAAIAFLLLVGVRARSTAPPIRPGSHILVVALASGALVGLGYSVDVVPGVLFMCLLFVAMPAAVMEGSSVWLSFTRSRELTSGHMLRIFAASMNHRAAVALPERCARRADREDGPEPRQHSLPGGQPDGAPGAPGHVACIAGRGRLP
jgi:hypothetical protein